MTDNDSNSSKMFKVAFDLPSDGDFVPPVSTERLWAEKTDVKRNLRVVNTPFYIRGISYGDIILVRPDNERREIVFEKLVAESGHSTVALFFLTAGGKTAAERLLEECDCSWEAGVPDYVSVDIKPAVDYMRLRAELIKLKENGLIGIQENSISFIHQSQLPSFP